VSDPPRADTIHGYVVSGGWWHDFDFARLQILQLCADHDRVRVGVAQHYEDVAAISACDFLVSYTCNVRPSTGAQDALRSWVERGGRWLALHATNSAIDPPPALGQGSFETPRAFPTFVDTLGSQFLSHPAIEPYRVTVTPGAEADPMVADIEPFEANDELYLSELHGDLEVLLETRWTGDTGPGFAEREWPDDDPRPVLYRRRIGDGCVLYLTLGHCRGHHDMGAPPFNGMWWPHVERGSWDVPEYRTLLRRSLAWAATGEVPR